MQAISPERPLGELVAERPARARVFERLGLDYCCGGKRSLAESCQAAGFELAEVASLLADADQPEPDEPDWRGAPLASLCEHIVERHHGFLREELPRLGALSRRVASAHGARNPELHEVEELLQSVTAELELHMTVEEGVLFPACQRLETDGASGFATLADPISIMESDHDQTAHALVRLRTITSGYAPPSGACNSYRALLDGLQTLEEDLHRHVHEENNILFPRALELERAPSAARPATV
jgi:regulator of cell morphogenesis and NO signaling